MAVRIFLPNCGKYALIDDEDHARVSRHRWYAYNRRTGREDVRTNYCHKKIILSRFIIGARKGQFVTFKNWNPFDCRKENLIVCSLADVSRRRHVPNTSTGYRGVKNAGKKYEALIRSDDVTYYLGVFPTAKEAAKAYDAKAVELFGQFAVLNFPAKGDG